MAILQIMKELNKRGRVLVTCLEHFLCGVSADSSP